MCFREGFYDIYLELCCCGLCYVVSIVLCKFVEYGFLVVYDEMCYVFEMILILMYWCYDSVNRVFYVEYFLILLIIILNLIVFVIIVIIKVFRKLLMMLLVVNLVMSDFFVGVYFLVIILFCYGFLYLDFVGVMNYFCLVFGFLWVFG